MGRLEGKVALVTAAGQGIGRATAQAFVREGARVIATDVRAEALEGLDGAETRVLDVTNAAAVRAIAAANPEINVLYNCAGVVHAGTILDCDEDQWDFAYALNVTAQYRMIRAVLPGMIARKRGAIINVASVASSISGVAERAAYGASKAAVIGLTKAVARDTIATGVRCNALCPGTTDTPSLGDRIAQADDPDALRRTFVSRQPMGRLGRAEEMGEAALFLADDSVGFMSGGVLVIDGGQTL